MGTPESDIPMGAPWSPRRSFGAELIAKERRRQVEAEGWTAEHDDEHYPAELIVAANCYLGVAIETVRSGNRPSIFAPSGWPWDNEWWKPSDDPIRNLVKAGALIAAEIDRLQRVGQSEGTADRDASASGKEQQDVQ